MMTLVRRAGRPFRGALVNGLAALVVGSLAGKAEAGGPAGAATCPTCHKAHTGAHNPINTGYQGFGLGYHLGYGYGGDALGVGPDGGYPFYGGPGYPHPWPRLRRFGGINPFPYYGGPGGPTPSCPNYFAGVGPLTVDRPVIEVQPEPGEADYASGYGAFTGVLPYPEAAFASFTVNAANGGSDAATPPSAPPDNAPAPSEPSDDQSASRSLGIGVEPFSDAGGPGLKVTRLDPGSPAEQAGLRDGDVIRSSNGYVTARPTNMAWILANAAPDRILKLTVRPSGGRQVRTITVRPRSAAE